MIKKVISKITEYPIASILFYAIVLRILVLIFYSGYTIFPDSEGYITLANRISDFNLMGYTGERTPGYPSFIALLGNNLHLVIWSQLVLGVIGTYLIYDMTLQTTKDSGISVIVAVITSSFLHVVFYDFAIMTESLALFCMVLTFWFIKKYDIFQIEVSVSKLIVLSFLLAILYLIRPMFVYIPILMALFFMIKNISKHWIQSFYKALIILVFPFIAFYSWASLNKKNIGVFGSTYFMGINLIQTATPFFEEISSDESQIREILVKHREIVETTEPDYQYPMSVWYAYEELLEVTELSPPRLSEKLGQIAIGTFQEHPLLYLKQVGVNWWLFWNEEILWNVEKINSQYLRKGLIGLWIYIQVYVGLAINLLFIYFGFKKLIGFMKSGFKIYDFDLLIVLLILLGSFAQALVTYGSNQRFSFPYLSLIVYFVVINFHSIQKPYGRRT